MNRLAGLYMDEGKYAEAESLYRKLLARDEKVLGANKPAVASDLDNLGRVLKAQARTKEAQAETERAAEIKKKLPGAQPLSVVVEESMHGAGGEPGPSTPLKDKWALCIGISNFKDSTINLKYAAKDATDFRNFLISTEHFQPDHVKLLTDAAATRANIVGQLSDQWLGKVAKAEDLVIVYVSSHGSTAMEEANSVNFLVPYDGNRNNLLLNGIPMQWLNQIMKEEVRSARVMLILDVCHSGAAAGAQEVTHRSGVDADVSRRGSGGAGGTGNAAENVEAVGAGESDGKGGKGIARVDAFDIGKVTIGTGQIVLCSSMPDQVSWESKEYPNSVFTRRLIEGLQSHGHATTLTQAYSWMHDKVQEEVLRDRGEIQSPVIKKAWGGADLVPSAVPATN